MNTVNKSSRKKRVKYYWLPVILILLLLSIIAFLINYYKGEKQFAVVTLYGNDGAINISKNFNLTQFSSGNKYKGALLAEEGDLLALNNTSTIYHKNTGLDSMQVNDDGDSLFFVNGNVNSINISGKENLIPWFRTMKAATIEDLQTIRFSAKIPVSYIPFLKEIARLKPNIALVFEKDDSTNTMDDYLSRADFFSPRFVQVSMSQNKLTELAHWKSAEILYLVISDSEVATILPAMPALKECILFGDDLTNITASFFSNNPQLEKLTLIASLTDYALLQQLNKLQEISLHSPDSNTDILSLKSKLDKLSVLILSGRFNNIDSLAGLNNLRWLGLPKNISQLQFNAITATLPDLQVLELTGSDSLSSLAGLQQLHKLKGLVITDTVTDRQSLYVLTQLRYLSVPIKNKTDSIYLLSLEKALPGCIVVPNSGACLGSGWLLLIIPLILILLAIYKHHVFKRNGYDAP